MIVNAGLAEPWVGQTLPSHRNRLGTSQTRWSESTTLFSGRVPCGPADQVREALDREHVLGSGGVQDVLDHLGRVGHVGLVVVAQGVVEAGDRDAVGSVSAARVTRFSGWGSSSLSTPIVAQWL